MATLSLLQHYMEYLISPPVLLAIVIVIGPILLEVYKNRILRPVTKPIRIPWCFRLGITRRSNLQDQYQQDPSSTDSNKPVIKALFTYPIKSCQGVELSASEVVPTGLKYDRLFTFAQLVSVDARAKRSEGEKSVKEASSEWKHEWRFMTQRNFPRLALLQTELHVPDPKAIMKVKKENPGRTFPQSWAANGGCLIVRFPFEPDFNLFGLRTETVTIHIALAPSALRAQSKAYTHEKVKIWKDQPLAINLTNEIPASDLAKLKYFLGVSNPLGLFRVDDRNRRMVTRSLPEDGPENATYNVGFGDAFPLHILSLSSVRAVDGELPADAKAKGELDARRFRANIYLSGTQAYDEDSWKKILIGRCIRSIDQNLVEMEGEYHVACRTARCKLPNVHPNTGVKDANEPSTTLTRTRQVDEGAKPHACLGMQMIPLFEQGLLRVGDEIEVVETGDHVYEKMFG